MTLLLALILMLLKRLPNALNMDIELHDRPFGLLLPQIELGQIHAIAAGMTPTPERAERVYFTKAICYRAIHSLL